MTHNDKIAALMAAINDNIILGDAEKSVVASALVEGFIRILEVEDAERKAQQPHCYFPVEFSPAEGFSLWNSGGFRGSEGKGTSLVSVGVDGNHTRILRTMAEVNGRHQLTVVYPGCYIAQGKTVDPLSSPVITIYQILGFSRSETGFQARCSRILRTVDNLEEDKRERFGLLISVCRELCITQNAKEILWREG